MFYDPILKDHGLERDPFKALIVPRPIGWISTVDKEGVANLAPYSFFNAVSSRPPIVMFASESATAVKDSQRNAEATGEFVVNMATWDLRDAMNVTSASVRGDEMALAGLEKAPCRHVKAPRVAASPMNLECRYLQTITLPGGGSVVIGQVVGIHIRDDVIVDGRIDYARMRPIARLGYMDYAVIDEVFSMDRPA